MMIHHSLTLEDSADTHRWCGQFMVDEGVYGEVLNDVSELDQEVNQSILRKLAQPNKPKNKP